MCQKRPIMCQNRPTLDPPGKAFYISYPPTHTTHHSLSFSFSHTHTHTQGQGNIYSDDEQTRDQSRFERFCEELTENSEAAITKVLEHVLHLQKNNFYIYKTVRPPSPRFFIRLLRIQANMFYIYKRTTSISTKEQLLYLQENI